MAVICKNLGVLALAIQLCQAQFTLDYPTRIGFDYSLEDSAPCGYFTPDFSTDNITEFHVGGDTIAVTSLEEEATWLFRATLDETALGNWTSLLPVIQEKKLGGFCEPSVTVPSSWAGNQGIVGVVQHANGGLSYQCAAVKFVAGKAAATPAVCMNMTDLTATYTSDASLSSIPASGGPTVTASSVATTSSSGDSSNDSSSPSSSSTKKSSASLLYSQEASSTLLLAFLTSLFML